MLRYIFIAVLTLGTITVFGQKKETTPPAPQIDYKQIGAPMPAIELTSIDTLKREITVRRKFLRKKAVDTITVRRHSHLTEKDIKCEGNLLVMMFNPTCGHCEDQTERMTRNISLFNKSKMVLMAKENMSEYLPNFVKNHHIGNYFPIYLGVDKGGFMDKTFLYSALPQINIYSPDHKLIRSFAGEVPIDTLKQYIQ